MSVEQVMETLRYIELRGPSYLVQGGKVRGFCEGEMAEKARVELVRVR